MADELNIPTHRWYQKRNHIALAKDDFSRQYIYDSGIQKIDAWINSQPWGDVYIVNRLSPPLVLDFIEDYYRTGGSASTFDDALNFSRAGNATMVDSDGVLKWAPHNILARSQDFETLWTTTGSTTVTGDFAVAPDGTMTAARVLKGSGTSGVLQQTLTVGDNQTKAIWARTPSGSGTVALLSFNGQTPSPVVTVTEEWQLFELASDTAEPGGENFYAVDFRGGTLTEVYIWGAHLYRSDLGGMVDNPATGNSYVPTTDSARYLPRVGNHVYNGSEWGNEGLLLESEARANLLTYSEDFKAPDGSWGKTRVTVSSSTGVLPTGSGSVSKITEDGASGVHQLYGQNVSGTQTVTVSGYFKAAEYSVFQLTIGASASQPYVNFDLSSQSVTASGNGGSGLVEAVGNGWFRCSMTGLPTINGSWMIFLTDGNTSAPRAPAYAGDGTSGIYIYGAQLEVGSTPSSYIPTAGSTVTRAAEILDVAAADMPWSSSAVSIQMDGAMTYTDNDLATEVSFHIWRLTSTDFINTRLNTQSSRTGQVMFYQREAISGQSTVGSINAAYAPGINVPFSIASRHGSTFINGAVDGTALTANTTPTALPDLSTTDFDIGPTFMGNIGKLRVWAEDLGDTGIEEAST